MKWIESMQRAIDYMEDHLLEDITIDDISAVANSSPFHFQRIFTVLTEMPVGEYLRRRRLTLAAHELSRTNDKIIEIAMKYGYDTPEAFSKAFRRQHGISPSEARKYTGKLKSYNHLVIQVSLKGAEPMQYKVVELEGFHVVGVKREFSLVNEENMLGIPKMWEEVNGGGTSDLLVRFNNGQVKGLLGVCVDKSNDQSKTMEYWIAAAHEGETPENLLKLDIPASKWAIFEVHGPMPTAMTKMWKQIFTEWFPSSGYEPAGTPELELYTGSNVSASDYYSEIWIPVK
ncbi:AraC family transcriptional regulator [Mesobacillus zeae]|uniref:AraC family transcriptional regulator n=1 Tax=Mesobacillus zeae TaxID=1917180 RepID=A0A398AXD0_9BACI|nr:AraC family transcriptional regulator [Mesobacillus zeae]RID82319.1 AraC family transcriptional regulator [Mesobacillus zeae]